MLFGYVVGTKGIGSKSKGGIENARIVHWEGKAISAGVGGGGGNPRVLCFFSCSVSHASLPHTN